MPKMAQMIDWVYVGRCDEYEYGYTQIESLDRGGASEDESPTWIDGDAVNRDRGSLDNA